MSKNIGVKTIASNLIISIVIGFGTVLAPLIYTIVNLNGGIEYTVTRDQNSFYTTIVISNRMKSGVNFEISTSAKNNELISTAGAAKIVFETVNRTSGELIKIEQVDPGSRLTLLLKSPISAAEPKLKLLKSPSGIEVNLVDPIKNKLSVFPGVIYGVMLSLMFFVSSTFMERKISSLTKKIESSQAELKRLVKTSGKSAKKLRSNIERIKFYYLRSTTGLRKEVEFWQNLVMRTLRNQDVSRELAHELIGVVRKQIGSYPQKDEEFEKLELGIEVLIDDIHRKNFDQQMNLSDPNNGKHD